jgi:hypothetical protein
VTARIAALLLAVCALTRAVSFVRPCLSDDEAIYAVVGRELLAGRALYADVVDHKPPAIYLVNAATQAIGGTGDGGMLALHVLLVVVVWATALVLGRIAQRTTGDARAGPLAALLYIVFTSTLVDVDAFAANCELFMMLPLAGSVALVLGERSLRRLALAGALVGVAMLFKYQAAVQLPVYAIAIAWERRARRGKAMESPSLGRSPQAPAGLWRAAAELVALGAGVALPIALVAAWLHAIGALDAAWFWFRFNFAYIDQGGASVRVQMLVRAGFAIVACAPLYAFAVAAALRARPRAFVLGWLAASALAVATGGRFFGHYFHQLAGPLAVIAAPAAVELAARRRAAFVAALAIPAAIFVALAALHDRVMAAAGEPDPDYASVAAWLDAHGAPDDALCVWGNSPVLYFEARRPLGCRFVFANYLTGLSPATPSQSDPDVDSSANVVAEAWPMLVADLATRRPTFVVDGSPGDVAFYGKYPPAKFPIGKILACDYAPVADIAGMRVYRRVAPRCAR